MVFTRSCFFQVLGCLEHISIILVNWTVVLRQRVKRGISTKIHVQIGFHILCFSELAGQKSSVDGFGKVCLQNEVWVTMIFSQQMGNEVSMASSGFFFIFFWGDWVVNLLHRILFGEEFSKNGNLGKAPEFFCWARFLDTKKARNHTFFFGMKWITLQ